MKMTVITIDICEHSTVTKGLIQGLEDLDIRGLVETIQATSVEISQNTEKYPGNLKILAFTQTPVKKLLKLQQQ